MNAEIASAREVSDVRDENANGNANQPRRRLLVLCKAYPGKAVDQAALGALAAAQATALETDTAAQVTAGDPAMAGGLEERLTEVARVLFMVGAADQAAQEAAVLARRVIAIGIHAASHVRSSSSRILPEPKTWTYCPATETIIKL